MHNAADPDAQLAFGITAASRLGHDRLGRELERLGYAETWSNDTRRGDGIAALDEVAAATTRLRLAVGVVALSEQAPARIAGRVRASSLPLDRFTLGVGSGSSRSLALVRGGVAELRRLFPDLPIAVSAVGPRMARLAGEIADAVVANWALPERLAFVREQVSTGAVVAGRPAPRLVAYVRTAIGPDAERRLLGEQERYAHYGPHYANAFADQAAGAAIGIAMEHPDGTVLAAALAPYREVADTVVVRGLPAEDTVDGWLEIAGAAVSGAW